MTDNQLIQLFIPILTAGFTAAGLGMIPVRQAYEPTEQGVYTAPAVYYHKLSDHQYGWLKRENYWNQESSQEMHKETQKMEVSFRISALSIQNPATPDQLTASDLVNRAALILKSDQSLLTLRASRVGIYNITDVVNPYFEDDKGRYEASPSFDFTLTTDLTSVSEIPVVESVQFGIFRT
jgi:hypothetical protein